MKKNLIKIFLSAVFCVLSFGFYSQQNLIQNSSFEDTLGSGCPTNISQLNKTKYWFNTNGSTDYFNICYNGPFNYCIVPNNGFGYQQPHNITCKAYAGIQTSAPGFNNINEIFAIKISDSLIIGQKYYFSINVSLANQYKYAANNIGVFFGTKQPIATGTANPNNFCQINFSQVISDTLNWTSLFKSFIADSNYKYLSVGNFKDSSNTIKVMVNPVGFVGSYYFIDDICLSTDSILSYNYNFNCGAANINESSPENILFNIFPNPNDGKIKISNKNEYYSLNIYNTLGEKILSIDRSNNNDVDLNNFFNGIYYVEIYNNQFYRKEKLIIQK